MDEILLALKAECDRAARDFLSIEGWASPKWKIRMAVDDLLAGAERYSIAMSKLLREATKVPAQFEPNRKLYELVRAIKDLRVYQNPPACPPAGPGDEQSAPDKTLDATAA